METLLRETRATRVSVIDKDGGQAGVLVQHRGYPADIPAVTRRNQWQETNGRVFSRMQGTRPGGLRQSQIQQHIRLHGVGHGAGAQLLRRVIQRYCLQDFTAGKPLRIGLHGVGNFHVHIR